MPNAASRTIVYVDGFNFYYGEVRGTLWKWLDPVARGDESSTEIPDVVCGDPSWVTTEPKGRVRPGTPPRVSDIP